MSIRREYVIAADPVPKTDDSLFVPRSDTTGYVGSTSSRAGSWMRPPPPTTALGALLAHVTQGADARTFQPMNVNFGLFPELAASERARGRDRKNALARRALADFDAWLGHTRAAAE